MTEPGIFCDNCEDDDCDGGAEPVPPYSPIAESLPYHAGVCILTGEAGENSDDCTTHEHEVAYPGDPDADRPDIIWFDK